MIDKIFYLIETFLRSYLLHFITKLSFKASNILHFDNKLASFFTLKFLNEKVILHL